MVGHTAGKLRKFYFTALLPELACPRHRQGVIREPCTNNPISFCFLFTCDCVCMIGYYVPPASTTLCLGVLHQYNPALCQFFTLYVHHPSLDDWRRLDDIQLAERIVGILHD